jgi:hypothetical protein
VIIENEAIEELTLDVENDDKYVCDGYKTPPKTIIRNRQHRPNTEMIVSNFIDINQHSIEKIPGDGLNFFVEDPTDIKQSEYAVDTYAIEQSGYAVDTYAIEQSGYAVDTYAIEQSGYKIIDEDKNASSLGQFSNESTDVLSHVDTFHIVSRGELCGPPPPLSSDAFSTFSNGDPNERIHNETARAATLELLFCLVPAVVSE